jgi:hypothetical protein
MKRYLTLILGTLALLAALALAVQADGAITIARSVVTYTFQKEARFTLEATSDSEIVKATLRFRLADQTATNANEKTVTPAKSVTVEHVWSLTDADLPSGTIVTYWWTVEDKAGARAESERRSFLYEDTRYAWKKISKEDITLSWYRGDDALGRELLDAAVSAYRLLAAEFAVERKPAYIYIYGSFDDLRSGIGESAQEWTGGRAYPELNVTLIGVPPNQLSFGKRAVPHEFSHLIIHRATQNPYGGLPRWLDEGLAMWAEGELEAEYRTALSQAVRSNTLLSLKTLSSNFPADSKQATLAYAESYSAVVFIRDTYGREKIGQLLKVFKEGSTDDDALQRVLGVNTAELDARWRASLGVPSPQTMPAAGDPGARVERSPLSPNATALIVMGMLAGVLIIFVFGALIVVLLV